MSFINLTVHTGCITNTIHVIQFLDGLSLYIHGTAKSFGHLYYGLQHYSTIGVNWLTIDAHQFNNQLEYRSITKRTNVLAVPRFEPGSFMTERECSTNWAINHWHVKQETCIFGVKLLHIGGHKKVAHQGLNVLCFSVLWVRCMTCDAWTHCSQRGRSVNIQNPDRGQISDSILCQYLVSENRTFFTDFEWLLA
jgi:hypothetical protein